MAEEKTAANKAEEIPDQVEDPEGYAAHVDKVREEDAELAQQQEDLARQRGFVPPEPDPQPTFEEQQQADRESVQPEEAKSAKKSD